jgi:hypothetical protein
MTLDAPRLASIHPRLFHMAEAGSWPAIREHGLRSTSALLDLFEVAGEERAAIEDRHRASSTTLTHPVHGEAVVRDQLAMSDAGLRKALRDGLQPRDGYRLLNGRVFFWLTEARLERLLAGREGSS